MLYCVYKKIFKYYNKFLCYFWQHVVVENVDVVLAACPAGTFGPECRGQCTCDKHHACHHITGECVCKPGYSGVDCKTGETVTIEQWK